MPKNATKLKPKIKNTLKVLKVLVVEDDEPILKAVLFKLKKVGVDADFAMDGVEGIKMLEKNPDYDGVLLDIHMPKGNGFMFLEEKAKNKNFDSVPVVVFTNLSQPEFVKRAIDLGAKGYLFKANHSIKGIIDELKKCIDGLPCKIDY